MLTFLRISYMNTILSHLPSSPHNSFHPSTPFNYLIIIVSSIHMCIYIDATYNLLKSIHVLGADYSGLNNVSRTHLSVVIA